MSSTEVQFYFDFVSPYSYLAYKLLQRLKEPWKLKIIYKPARLPYIIKATGNNPPASNPKKAAFLGKDLMRTSKLYGIPLKLPKNFLSISMKAPELIVHAAQMILPEDKVAEIIDKIWDEFFGKGNTALFTPDPQTLSPLIENLFPAEAVETILKSSVSEKVERVLKATTDEAISAGAFGLPVMLVTKDNHVEFFFGSDRFQHIADYLGVDPRPLYEMQSKF